MSHRSIPLRVERTRNRHSRAVFKDNTIVIRLAKNLTEAEEQEHIEDLKKSMERQILEDLKRKPIDPFKSLLDGAEQATVRLANGTRYEVVLLPGKRNRSFRTDKGWVIEVAPNTKRKGLHRLLWSLLSEAEIDRVLKIVDEINGETFKEHYHTLKLNIATSQWGSCTSHGALMLNSALLFVPDSVLRYVIIHELAHFKHPDHSSRYWQHVAKAMPGYKRAIGLLKRYRLPTLL